MRQSSQAAAFVGRDNEMEIVHRRLAALGDGQGAVVLVSGEPGIGKTALTLACAESGRAMGAAVPLGRCYEGGGQPPFAPWGEVFADLWIGRDDSALPPPFGAGAAPQSAHQLRQVLASLLQERARDQPLMVVLEDVHWADGDALELLEVATRHVTRAALLVMATYRPEAAHRSHPFYDVLARLRRDRPVEFLPLSELGVEETGRLVEAVAGACSAELGAYLHARADGHPLFTIELLRDLQERRRLPRDEAGRLLQPTVAAGVPSALGHVIGHRIGRLGVDVEALLVVAAVAGEEWDLGIVESVLGWDEEPLLRALDEALRAEVIVPVAGHPERFRFRHALIRDALYDDQLARRRKHLHLRIGTVLEERAERESDSAALAHHFGAAEVWEKAVRYGIAAGDTARDRYASHRAISAYGQALAALEQASAETERAVLTSLLERLGRAYQVIDQHERAEETFQRMLEAARATGDRGSEAQALSWLGFVRRKCYNMVGAHEAGEAALLAAREAGEPSLLAQAHWSLGQTQMLAGNLDDSIDHAWEAERLARAAADRDVLTRSLQLRGLAAFWRGKFAESQLCNEEALVLARADRDSLAVTGSHWRLGLALGEVGRFGAARKELLAGFALAEANGVLYYQAKLLNTIGWVHLELGDAEEAAVWNQRALEAACDARPGVVTEERRHSLLNLVASALAAGDARAAEAATGQLDAFASLPSEVDYIRFRYLSRYLLLRAEIALVQGDREAALRFAGEAATVATDYDMPKHLAKSRLLTGRAFLAQGNPSDAAGALTEAVELADRIGHASLRWQGRLWLGQALDVLRRNSAETYRGAWSQICAIADEVGDEGLRARFLAWPLVEQVRCGAESGGRREPAERPAGLTERELEVLRLLVRRRTDKEIAEDLFIGDRTVETHVRNIIAKLGVANRLEAGAAAERLGIV